MSSKKESRSSRWRSERRRNSVWTMSTPSREVRTALSKLTNCSPDEALADGEGPRDALPRSASHYSHAAATRARRCSPRAAPTMPPRREDDDRHVRPSRGRGSARRDQPASTVAVCCILAARPKVHACSRGQLDNRRKENQVL